MVNESTEFAAPSSEHRTRFLLPFFWERNALKKAESAMLAWTHEADKTRHCWEKPEVTPSLYQDEILPSVFSFLFGGDNGSCAYFRVPDETANYWFKNGVTVSKNVAAKTTAETKRPTEFSIKLAAPGIELFLSPHGAGVFSVTFAPKESDGLTYLQELNYRLSQVREFAAYPLRLPHALENQNPPPGDKAAFTERLGKAGGAFALMEWVDFLLQPLRPLSYRAMQQQFSVYSVTRFCESAVFADADVRAALRPFLVAIAHVEEFRHVGSSHVCEQLLNQRHWAAVGSLGAAHLVSDQNPTPRDFDLQRLAVSLHKYFVPYLVTLMQRIALQGILEEARDIMVSSCGNEPDGSSCWTEPLRRLNRLMLAFTVNGWFTEVSSREVVNQYYALAQRGLRVQDSLRTVQRALQDAEAMDNGRFQSDSLSKMGELAKQTTQSVGIVAHVQSKVEWLEVFFVSYYATALVYYLKGSHFLDEDYANISLLAAPLVSGGIAFWRLRPDELYKHDDNGSELSGGQTDHRKETENSSRRSLGFMAALISAFLIWLAIGMGSHGCKISHQVSSQSAESSGPHLAPDQTPAKEPAPTKVKQ